MGTFPTVRLRRLRHQAWCRALVAETILTPSDFILPVFVREASVSPHIKDFHGVTRLTVEELPALCDQLLEAYIPAVALFPVLDQEKRDARGSQILNPENLLIKAIQKIKSHTPSLGVITDVALDAFTDHGQDGLVTMQEGHQERCLIANDETLLLMSQAAVLQAQAGADMIAPSDMMDGRVGAIRRTLDDRGFQHVCILSYTSKYASAFYGPFREALGSKVCLGGGDKKTYQMDPRNAREALREASLDVQEGADILMVKPGMPYLDIVVRLREAFDLPIFAYQVSGEYTMLRTMSNYQEALIESLVSLKRAGADAILTYGALDAVQFLKKR